MTATALPKISTDVARAARIGHIPASGLLRVSARKKKPIATPEIRAMPTPGGNRPRLAGASASAGAVSWLTSTIAARPTTIPTAARMPGRSPRATEASTGSATAQTAVVGATTAMRPIASAR